MMIVAYRIDSRMFLIFVRISWFYHFIVRLTRINVGALQKSLQLVIVRFWLVSTFHPTVAPLSEVSLWTDEGNKVWMCTHTNKLSQWWIQVKTTKYLDIYLGDPSVWYDLDEMFDVSATWIDDYVCTYSLHLYVSVTRQSEGNDCRNRVMSKYIISTYGELSLLQALDNFVSSQSQVAIAILSQSYSLHTINHLWIYWIMTYCFKSSA